MSINLMVFHCQSNTEYHSYVWKTFLANFNFLRLRPLAYLWFMNHESKINQNHQINRSKIQAL